MRLVARLLAFIAILVGMSAISLAQTITSSGSSVKIVSIAPELSVPLHVGEKQTIVVEVEYVMSQDSGTITLVIQKGESGGRPLGSSTEVVLRGKGKIKLEATIQVPDTKAIKVFTPLSYQDGAGTSIVDYRAYEVADVRAQTPAQRGLPVPEAAPRKSAVSIVSIKPDPALPLKIGERVKLQLVVAHTLDSDSGTITIYVQAADNSKITQNFDVISRGTARTTLKAEFTVPATKAIQVFVPIHARGQGPTSTLDSRTYRVVAN